MFFPLCILCSLKWYFIWHLVVVNIHNQMVASLFEESRTKYGITLKSKAVKHLNPFSFCHPWSREIKTKLMVWFFSLLWKELCTACYLPRFSYHLFKISHACSFPRPVHVWFCLLPSTCSLSSVLMPCHRGHFHFLLICEVTKHIITVLTFNHSCKAKRFGKSV